MMIHFENTSFTLSTMMSSRRFIRCNPALDFSTAERVMGLEEGTKVTLTSSTKPRSSRQFLDFGLSQFHFFPIRFLLVKLNHFSSLIGSD